MPKQKLKVTREDLAKAINDYAAAMSNRDITYETARRGSEIDNAEAEFNEAAESLNNLLDKLYGVTK